MTETGIHISSGLDVLRPKSGNAYPIPCDEWDLLKSKLTKVALPPWFYQTVGSVLMGVAGSMLVTILSGTLPAAGQSNARVIASSTVIVATVCGLLSFLFAHKERDLQAVYISEVIQQMSVIENRYEASTYGGTLILISALYGANDKFGDVTEILQGQVYNAALVAAVGNHLCGDPIPNTPKKLIVKYSYNGLTQEKTVPEGFILRLP